MNIAPITNYNNKSSKCSFKGSDFYSPIKKLPKMICASCGKPTLYIDNYVKVLSNICKPLSKNLESGVFDLKFQKSLPLIYAKLLEFANLYPKKNIDEILESEKGAYTELKRTVVETLEDKTIKNNTPERFALDRRINGLFFDTIEIARSQMKMASTTMKHLLKLMDLSAKEINEILNLADQLKFEKKNGIEHHLLKGKTLGMIFSKSSTRTRVSFEVGMYDLGGSALFLSSRDLQIGRGEPVQDTARVLSRYLDGIMIRTFEQSEVENLAKYGSIPIINGLTDFCHPCQVLADLMTVREHKGHLDGLKMTYIGDGNNMANSLIVGGLKMGMDVTVACPENYDPDKRVLDFAKEYSNDLLAIDVDLKIEQMLDTAWNLFGKYFTKSEVSIKKEFMDKYWTGKED